MAAEMRAGGAYAHATLALNAMEHSASRREPEMAGVGQGTAVAVAEQMGAYSASRPSFDPRKDVDARVGYQGRSTLATAPPYPDNI